MEYTYVYYVYFHPIDESNNVICITMKETEVKLSLVLPRAKGRRFNDLTLLQYNDLVKEMEN